MFPPLKPKTSQNVTLATTVKPGTGITSQSNKAGKGNKRHTDWKRNICRSWDDLMGNSQESISS